MTDNKKLLFEELSVPGGEYNSHKDNPSGMSQRPKKVSLTDLLDYQRRTDNLMTRAPNVTPYPLTSNLIEHIGDIYVQAAKIQSELGQAYQSPLISDDENAAKTLKNLYKKLEKIKLIVKSVANEMTELEIE
jgi:hypothetical protein